MILEISARFGNLLEGETQRQTEVPRFLFSSRLKDALDELKQGIRQKRSKLRGVISVLTHFMLGISTVNVELQRQIIFRSPSEGKTELRQNDELTRFLQSMKVTAERIQENLTQLILNPEWTVIEEEKEKKNPQENVSAVINGWIHRQG